MRRSLGTPQSARRTTYTPTTATTTTPQSLLFQRSTDASEEYHNRVLRAGFVFGRNDQPPESAEAATNGACASRENSDAPHESQIATTRATTTTNSTLAAEEESSAPTDSAANPAAAETEASNPDAESGSVSPCLSSSSSYAIVENTTAESLSNHSTRNQTNSETETTEPAPTSTITSNTNNEGSSVRDLGTEEEAQQGSPDSNGTSRAVVDGETMVGSVSEPADRPQTTGGDTRDTGSLSSFTRTEVRRCSLEGAPQASSSTLRSSGSTNAESGTIPEVDGASRLAPQQSQHVNSGGFNPAPASFSLPENAHSGAATNPNPSSTHASSIPLNTGALDSGPANSRPFHSTVHSEHPQAPVPASPFTSPLIAATNPNPAPTQASSRPSNTGGFSFSVASFPANSQPTPFRTTAPSERPQAPANPFTSPTTTNPNPASTQASSNPLNTGGFSFSVASLPANSQPTPFRTTVQSERPQASANPFTSPTTTAPATSSPFYFGASPFDSRSGPSSGLGQGDPLGRTFASSSTGVPSSAQAAPQPPPNRTRASQSNTNTSDATFLPQAGFGQPAPSFGSPFSQPSINYATTSGPFGQHVGPRQQASQPNTTGFGSTGIGGRAPTEASGPFGTVAHTENFFAREGSARAGATQVGGTTNTGNVQRAGGQHPYKKSNENPRPPRPGIRNYKPTDNVDTIIKWIEKTKKQADAYKTEVQAWTLEEKNLAEKHTGALEHQITASKKAAIDAVTSTNSHARKFLKKVEAMIDKAKQTVDEHRERASANSPGASSAPPDEFLCPITLQLMVNPTIAADGHSYEESAIKSHFRRSGRHRDNTALSPLTNKRISQSVLIPNFALRSMIQRWKENQESKKRAPST